MRNLTHGPRYREFSNYAEIYESGILLLRSRAVNGRARVVVIRLAAILAFVGSGSVAITRTTCRLLR